LVLTKARRRPWHIVVEYRFMRQEFLVFAVSEKQAKFLACARFKKENNLAKEVFVEVIAGEELPLAARN